MSSPDSVSSLTSVSGRPVSSFFRSPYFALMTLFSMNLLNYVDRYVFFSSGPTISNELRFNDSQFAQLSVSFIIVYTISSPFIGILGDRYSRRRLLSFGVALWSFATVGTAFASSYSEMFFWRALLGIGEASYGIIAPTLLADLFPLRLRGRVMGLYFLALPLGGAIGSIIGGYFSDHGNWRHAFWVVGIPGLFAAVGGLLMFDPGRGASEGKLAGQDDRPGLADYLSILKTRTFLYNTAGQAAVTFALGAYAVFAVTFFNRVRGMRLDQASFWIGVLTAGGGLVGILLGTVAADALLRRTKRAYLIWPAIAVGTAVPFVLGTILVTDRTMSLVYLFIASVLMASVLGPSNTVTANVVPVNRRAAGYALCIFLVHLFGDISSPLLIGEISDFFGRPSVMASEFGRSLVSIGAKPFPSGDGRPANLLVGMLAVVPMLVLGSFFYFRGAKSLPLDQDRARAEGSDDLAGPSFPH